MDNQENETKYMPPKEPWIPIRGDLKNGSYLAFYYSDPYSKIPVRRISSETDSKADPNIETGTFGLFSTCEVEMRKSTLNKGMKYIFFCTMRRDYRVLTGYYELGWHTLSPPINGYATINGEPKRDVVLAASKVKFINPGFNLSELTGYLEGVNISKRFRAYRRLDARSTEKLLTLIDETDDSTHEYLEEIARLEEENLKKVGYAYPNWKQKFGFSWALAGSYLKQR